MTCPECADVSRQGKRHHHFLTFTHMDDLRGHLETQGMRPHSIKSTLEWWCTMVDVYKGSADEKTGAPLSVSEAWVRAQQGQRVVPEGCHQQGMQREMGIT